MKNFITNSTPINISLLLDHYLHTLNNLKINRATWRHKEIPQGNTILQQTEKIRIAAQVFAKNHPYLNYHSIFDKATIHNWPKAKDECCTLNLMTNENRYDIEKIYMRDICKELPFPIDDYAYKSWDEFKQIKTNEDEILYQLKELDPIIMSLELEKNHQYHNRVQSLYTLINEKIKHPTLSRILNYLMQKEYPQINSYTQYFLLLETNGNINMFKQRLENTLTPQKIQQTIFN